MAGRSKGKIRVDNGKNLVLASEMMHKDVSAKLGGLTDADDIDAAREGIGSLTSFLERLDARDDDGFGALLDVGQPAAEQGAQAERDDRDAGNDPDQLPDPEEELPMNSNPGDDIATGEPERDVLPGAADHRMQHEMDDLPADDLPDDDHLEDIPSGGDLLPADAEFDDLPDDEEDLPEDIEDLQGHDAASTDEIDDTGDLLPDDSEPEFPGAEGDEDFSLLGNPDEVAGLDEILSDSAGAPDQDAAPSEAPMADPEEFDLADDEHEPGISGLDLDDELDGDPVSIGRDVDVSKLRARPEPIPSNPKPATRLQLTDRMRSDRHAPLDEVDDGNHVDDLPADEALDKPVHGNQPEGLDLLRDGPGTLMSEEGTGEPADPFDDLPDDHAPADHSGEALPDGVDGEVDMFASLGTDDGIDTASPADQQAMPKFVELSGDEVRAHEEISARAARTEVPEDDAGDGIDNGFFAEDFDDPYHDIDTGEDPGLEAAEPDRDDPALADRPGDADAVVDIDQDDVAMFDLSGDNGLRNSNPGDAPATDAGDIDMRFPGTRKTEPTESEDNLDVEARDEAFAMGDDDHDFPEDGSGEPDNGEVVAKKKYTRAHLMFGGAMAALLIGAGVFVTGAVDFGVNDLRGMIGQQQNSGAPSPRPEAPVVSRTEDPFAPIARDADPAPGPSVIVAEPQEGSLADLRDTGLTLPEDAPDAGGTLAEQLSRAAGGDLGDLALPSDETLAGGLRPDPMTDAPSPLAPPEQSDEVGIAPPMEEAEATTDIADVDDVETEAPAEVERTATTAIAEPGATPQPGSLDAAMAGFLSNYTTDAQLDAKLGGFTTVERTDELDDRITQADDRLDDFDAQIERLDDLDERIASATALAERAQELAIAQNDLVVEVVRMKGKVDMAESLIVDLSRRIASIEQIDPADKVAVDRSLEDLNRRVEGMARDIGLIARVAIKGEGAMPQSAARAPGSENVFARDGEAPKAKPEKRDPANIPADVKKGDLVEGYGYVLDIMPTERGRMVIMENESVIID